MKTRLADSPDFAPDGDAGPAAEPAPRGGGGSRLVRFGNAPEAEPAPAPAPPARPIVAEILHPTPMPLAQNHQPPVLVPAAVAPAARIAAGPPPGRLPARPPAMRRVRRRDPAPVRAGDLVTFGQTQGNRRGPARRKSQGRLRQAAGTTVGAAIALAMLLQRDHPGVEGLWLNWGALASWAAGLLALAGGIGLVAGVLARRGWGVFAVPLVTLLLPLHPIAAMAVQGPLHGDVALIATLGGILVLGLMLDRLEAVGDLRSLMGFGLALAVLLPLAPQSAPGALLAIAMLPVACRDMRDGASAIGVFLLALLPAAAVLLAIHIVAPDALAGLARQFAADGGGSIAALPVPWRPLHPAAPLFNLGALLMLVPPLLLVVATLARRTAERARPVTALYALAIGPVTLLVAGVLDHAATLPLAAAASLAGVLAWTMSTRLHPGERGSWVLLAGLGVALGWGLLWFGAGVLRY